MKKSDVVQIIFNHYETQISENHQGAKEKGSSFAPTNVALCKYWGKRDHELNLPMTSSLSVTLPDKGAMTHIRLINENADEVIMNQEIISADSAFMKRVVDFINLFRPKHNWHARIEIEVNIPIAAGLASSACGFASLVLALNDLFAWNFAPRDLSILARLGSGSAARSFWNGFVEWHAGLNPDGMDSYAEPLKYEWPELVLGILSISEEKKPISSREAMERTVNSSVLYANWPKKVVQDLLILRQSIHGKNFPLLGGVAESNALAMHATMMSSWPPICYFLPDTIAAMHRVWDLRKQGLEVYFTEDAGPNLKLLFLEKDKTEIEKHFPKIDMVNLF